MDSQALLMHLRYSAWASRRVLESAGALQADELQRDLGSSSFDGSANGGLYTTLTHIFQADAIWFDRLMGKPTGDLSVYDPPPELPAVSKRWLAVLDTYVAWAETLEPAGWDRIVPYRNTKGEAFESPVWQIVLHVVNHASYHRGQITTMLRQLGHTPAGTDLITYYRAL
jgi:uncharacterized damage-inducible protein DinB